MPSQVEHPDVNSHARDQVIRWLELEMAKQLCRMPVRSAPCGIILLSNEAILILHILRSIAGLFAPVEQVPEIQQIVHAKG